MECRFDRDCPGNEVCYSNVSWLSTLEDAMEKASGGCGCSTFYGFAVNPTTGLCSDYDVTGYFILVTCSMLVVLTSIALIVSLRDIWLLVYSKRLFGAIASTTIFTSLTLFFVLFDAALLISGEVVSVYSPVLYSDANLDSDKMAYNGEFERVVLSIAMLGVIISEINVPLYWLEVAERSRRANLEKIQNITKYRPHVLVFEALFAIVYIVVALILDEEFIMALVGLPVILAFMGLYIFTLRQMNSLFINTKINSLNSEPVVDSRLQLILEYTFTVKIILVGGVLFLYGLVAYGLVDILYGWREFCLPGRLSYHIVNIIVIRYGLFIITLGSIAFTHVRIRSITTPRDISEKSTVDRAGRVAAVADHTVVSVKSAHAETAEP